MNGPLILFFKATLRGTPGLSLHALTDRRGRQTSRWMRDYGGSGPEPAPPGSTRENIRRGRAAMAHVIAHQDDARSAMYRPGLGWIDFVWGSAGGAASRAGKRKGAMGVAHILEARQRKDGMTEAQTLRLAMFLPEVLARGLVARSDTYEDSRRAVISFAGYEATLVKRRNSNAWLLSGWKNNPR